MVSSRLFVAALGVLFTLDTAFAQESTLRKTIDAEIQAVWKREKVKPAPKCDDTTFLRRVFLDLVGVVPTLEETKKFLDEKAADKREKLVDQLLADPRFAKHQAEVWDLVFFGRHPGNIDGTRKRLFFVDWLTQQFAKNVPYNQWAKEILRAEQEGSEMFYVQYRNQPEEATVGISKVFLGTQLQCAQCHDHPFEKWTQRDFFGMAGFFVRLVVVDAGAQGQNKKFRIGEKSTGEVHFVGSVKDQKPGQKGEPVKPRFLGGDELAEPVMAKGFKEPEFKSGKPLIKPTFSRKEKIVDWITAPNNPYFARAVTNRVWAQFMGRGLVQPVDDLSERNTPSHPALLDAMTEFLKAEKFDLKKLIRTLVLSETYQLASTGENTEALPSWFERARVRPLSAEELMASFRTATKFPADGFKGSGEPTEYFLRYFGEPTDGQGTFQGGLAEHLFLNNSPQIRGFAQSRKGNLTESLLQSKVPVEEKVETLFLTVLNRRPSQVERNRFVKHLQSGDAKMAATLMEEAVWVLISCAEFRFNH